MIMPVVGPIGMDALQPHSLIHAEVDDPLIQLAGP